MTNERMEALSNQIAENLENETFCMELFQAENMQAVQQVLARYDVNATEDEMVALSVKGNAALEAMKNNPDELTDDEMGEVAGGKINWKKVGRFALAAGGGVVLGGTLGLVCGACPAFTPVAYKIGAGYAVASGFYVMGAK